MGMAKCGRNTVGSLVLAPAVGDVGGGFRLWQLFSAAAFRRKLADALLCGVSRHRSNSGSRGGFRTGAQRRAQGTVNPPPAPSSRAGSDRLSELLKAEMEMSSESEPDEAEAEAEAEAETRRKVEALEEFQRVVKGLQEPSRGVNGEWVDQRRDAAGETRRLAKGDAEAREMLAMLGAIPPLVAMLDSGDVDLQVEALYALLNLGIGNDMNKAAIVAVGTVHKMLKLIDVVETPPAVSMAVSANFLSLSALDPNKPIIGASGAIPFLLEIFRDADPSRAQARQDALRALFNLSIASSNIPLLVSAGIVPNVLSAVGDMEVTERALAVLSNVVSTAEGRRAVSRSPQAFFTLVEALDWSDAPGCQEQVAYVLMVMAHRASANDRAAMLGAGITSSLLELALLGTPLAQRRASRILERLRLGEGKGKQVTEGPAPPAVSAPLCEGSAPEYEENEAGMGEERRAVKQLVQQSLQSNMLRIARRANLPQDPALPDIMRSLPAAGATSKSLPF